MFRRKNLIALIVAELGGIMLLIILYLVFRTAPTSPNAVQTSVAQANTRAPVATLTHAPARAASTATIAVVEATPTALLTQYTVVEGDTLWGIAVNFHLSLDELVAANPSINPDRLYPGDIVNVPAPGTIDVSNITRQPTEQPAASAAGVTGRVKLDTGGLRLRKGPSINDEVITKLPDNTLLNLIGRSADSAWLQVTLSEGSQGWVMAIYVNVSGSLANVQVTGSAQASTGASGGNANATAAPSTSSLEPLDEPYLSGVTAKSIAIFKAGQALGNRVNAFALVGDSNTANPSFLQALDRGDYKLGQYAYLQDTIKFFQGSWARSQSSPAAVGGFNTTKALDPANSPGGCQSGETPVACEYRITRPGVALILLGTGDQFTWQGFEGRYRTIIQYTIDHGIIPVLITKGDDLESQQGGAPYGYINGVIARLSREYDVPLLDLRQAVYGLPNHGFNPDGFHYNTPPDGHPCYFTGNDMNYGYTIRNLTALQMLDAIRREVISAGT